jgi:pimeloyl-ACP methyl ester carboxylesterase
MTPRMRYTQNARRGPFAVKITLLLCLLALSWPAVAHAQSPPWPPPPICEEGSLKGQLTLICIPPGTPENPLANWNGQLVVYAHGYVAPQAPRALPAEELGRFPDLINVLLAQGFAFATSSYSKNGYAVEPAGKDLNALVRHFKTHILPNAGMLNKVFVVGASEGGLIATMLVEKHPGIYDGGLAMCGPIGGMPYQLQYLGDFRVVFDYFFPGVFDFGMVNVPENAWENWDSYETNIPIAIQADPMATAQLFSVTQAAYDPGDPKSYGLTTLGVLYYSIWGTNDLIATAGGMPYDNRDTTYVGSYNDAALNAGVERVKSDGRARAYARRAYQPSGELERPLVTLHNTLDPVVPFWHEEIYAGLATPSWLLVPIQVEGYGHCAFSPAQILGAFDLLKDLASD